MDASKDPSKAPGGIPAAAWPGWLPGIRAGTGSGAAAESASKDQCSHNCPAPSSPASTGKDSRNRVSTATGTIATAHSAATIAGSGISPPPAR